MTKIKQIGTYLNKNALDAFLVMTKVNRQYLSGFTGSKGILLVMKDKAGLYVDERYTIRAKKETNIPVHNISDLKIKKGFRVGVEDEISLYQFNMLKKQIQGVRWKVTRRVVDHIRAKKNNQELKYIAKGSKIIDLTFEYIKKLVKKKWKSGISEVEIAREIEKFGLTKGVDGLAFEPIVAFGGNAAAPHHNSSSQRRIGKNNFLLLDFGFVVNGYHSDFTRTLFIGKPNKKQTEIYNLVLDVQLAEIEKIKTGEKAQRVDIVGRGIIQNAGYGEKFTHCSGHGVGLEIHEAPNLCADSEDILIENSVVTVEPGIYIEGWGGVRIEDMVLVKKNQPELFSRIPKDLKSMIIK